MGRARLVSIMGRARKETWCAFVVFKKGITTLAIHEVDDVTDELIEESRTRYYVNEDQVNVHAHLMNAFGRIVHVPACTKGMVPRGSRHDYCYRHNGLEKLTIGTYGTADDYIFDAILVCPDHIALRPPTLVPFDEFAVGTLSKVVAPWVMPMFHEGQGPL